MITVKVILGSYFEKEVGAGEIEVVLKDKSTTLDLAKEIGKSYGQHITNLIIDKERECFKILVLVNGRPYQKEHILIDKDIVTILPPLAGG